VFVRSLTDRPPFMKNLYRCSLLLLLLMLLMLSDYDYTETLAFVGVNISAATVQ
jgi:hypothetical protein